ncbi:MAG: NUDIX hydrolase [Deltaproteobacteria bacterium]|nr:NUDIX hydrolase [Deltaproteobacteria bacterium]
MTVWRNPLPTVDVAIVDGDQVVLVRRRNPPEGWALPGGFVEEGEALEAAAVREAREETGLAVKLREQFFTYSDPARDPRRHTITTVFLAEAEGVPRGGDDAAEARCWPLDSLPRPLCFDHARILADLVRYLRGGPRPTLEGVSGP